MVWREGYKKIFAGGGGGVIFNMGVKKEDFTRKGQRGREKTRRERVVTDPKRNYGMDCLRD